MRVTVTPAEKLLVAGVLQFANMRRTNSTGEVEDLFKTLPFTGFYNAKGARVFQAIERGKGGVRKYEEMRDDLREDLHKLSGGKVREKEEVAAKVRDILSRMPVMLVPSPTGRPFQVYLFAGVQACLAYALLLLLDSSKRLGDRLGLCDAPRCNRFNLAFEGRPRRYCNETHRRKADLALRSSKRVTEWRKWIKEHQGVRKKRRKA